MKTIPRIHTEIALRHLAEDRQMLFFSGPRQIGKTTVCQDLGSHYLRDCASSNLCVKIYGWIRAFVN